MDLGRHLLMDFYGCNRYRLDDSVYIEDQLRSSAKTAGAHVLSATVHRFSPQGVTCILSLRESHLAIHTWPEHQFAAADLFSCGSINPWSAYVALEKALGATRATAREETRGSDFRLVQ